jgi:hypothetical protein
MFDLGKLRETAMRQGMKLMGDPRVMKLMQDPRFQKLMMKAFQLRGEMQARRDKRAKHFARRMHLATREEVESLKRTIRELESNLERLRNGQKQA